MRLVENALCPPHHCMAIPHLGASHSRGYVDTGNEVPCLDPHVYISVEAVEQMGKLIGLIPGEVHKNLLEECQGLEYRIGELEAELEQEKSVLEAIDTIESADFRRRRKMGRPTKESKKKVAA